MPATVTRRQQSRELGYAEITTTVSGIVSTTLIDVTGLSLSNLVIPTDRPVLVRAYVAYASNATANATVALAIMSSDGVTNYGTATIISATANARVPLQVVKRFAAGACPTALKVQVDVGSGTGTLACGAPIAPAFLQVTAL